MIVPKQENIKVHFAGAEDLNLTKLLTKKANINYHLFTVYPFIRKSQKNDSKFIEQIQSLSKHVIMDSGLFTLMFGAEAGKKDKKFLDNWTNKIIEFILETNYKGTYVDVDCQKVLGVKHAWRYRKLLKDKLPNNRQINVFHIEDGKKGLDELIEYSDYMAISVPELRAIKKKEYLYKIYNYIKNKKPNIDIHLLGFTEFKGLKKYRQASSCDSISWKQASMYGQMIKFNSVEKKVEYYDNINKKTSNKKLRVDLDKIAKKHIKTIKDFYPEKMTERGVLNRAIDLLNTIETKKVFEYYAGNQD